VRSVLRSQQPASDRVQGENSAGRRRKEKQNYLQPVESFPIYLVITTTNIRFKTCAVRNIFSVMHNIFFFKYSVFQRRHC
jgi:hypothetical protein